MRDIDTVSLESADLLFVLWCLRCCPWWILV